MWALIELGKRPRVPTSSAHHLILEGPRLCSILEFDDAWADVAELRREARLPQVRRFYEMVVDRNGSHIGWQHQCSSENFTTVPCGASIGPSGRK